MRKRSLAAAVLSAVALIGSLLVSTPAHALNDTGTGGVFVPATGRILDTAKGTGGFSTPMEAGKYRTIKVAGLAGLPDDGSVGAVSLNATVGGSSGAGTLYGRPDADSGRTTMLIYSGVSGEYTSNSATVAVGADGTIQVMTENATRLILDVQGYYTANTDGTAAGGFVPVAKRIVDTRSGLGAAKATIAPGKSVDVQITGSNGIPSGASGVVVNLIAINSTDSDGYLTPYATGGTKPQNSLHYAPSVTTSIQAQVPLSSAGKITIANASSTANLVIDLQGYFTAAGTDGAVFTPSYGRAYDSRASGNTVLAKGETRSIQIAGKGGVPVMGSGITAVTLTLIVSHAGSAGYAQVYADGTTNPGTTALNFQADDIRTNTITVPLGVNGKIALRNVADASNYLVDVQGWYVNPIAPTISCPTPYASGSWVTDVPTDDIACTIGLPAASSSAQAYDVQVDDVPYDTFSTQDSASSASIAVPAAPGGHTIRILSGDQIVNTYSFGLGQWQTAASVPSPESGTTATSDAELSVAPAGDEVYPDDVRFRYSIWSDQAQTSIVAQSDSETGGWTPPANTLATDTTYYWSVSISGSSANGPTIVQTPTWPIHIHNLTADEQNALTFQYTDGDTLQDLVQSGLDDTNSTQVADLLDNLSTSAGNGQDVGIPALANQSPQAAAAALSDQADAVRSGSLTADTADRPADSTPAATSGASVESSSSDAVWNDHIGRSPEVGEPVANHKAWEAIGYVHGLECRQGILGSSCDEKDKWRVKAIIDPGTRGAAMSISGSRQLAERNIIGNATWEWQAFRLRTVNGHNSAITVPTKSKRVPMKYYQNVKGFDSTFWFRLGGTKKGVKKSAGHTDTAYCTNTDCKWD